LILLVEQVLAASVNLHRIGQLVGHLRVQKHVVLEWGPCWIAVDRARDKLDVSPDGPFLRWPDESCQYDGMLWHADQLIAVSVTRVGVGIGSAQIEPWRHGVGEGRLDAM